MTYFFSEINKKSEYKFDKNGFVLIKKGCSAKQIVNELVAKNVIKDNFYNDFILGILKVKFGELKFGEYKFDNNISFYDAALQIINERVYQRKFLILEGDTAESVCMRLNFAYGLVGEDLDILEIEEGSVLPDTYFYTYGTDRRNLLKKTQQAMRSFLDKEFEKSSISTFFKNHREVIILASIIEKESSTMEEKKIVSSVYINRLKKGMRLQSCPTILYITKKSEINKIDLFIESPYNTYRNKGLPANPICNPGRDSIIAALNPAETSYLFFVSTKFGKNAFSEDFDQHVKRKIKYKKRS